MTSPASRAGLQAGAVIAAIDGQVPISTADYSWALHQFPDQGTLNLTIENPGGAPQYVVVPMSLEPGWQAATGMTQRVGNWPMRAMAFGGMRLEAMSDADKRSKGISADEMALLALNVGQYGRHALAKKQGFKKGDIIVEVDGSRTARSEGDLMADILLNQKAGTRIPATVLRNGKEIDLKIPVQ